MAAVVVVAPKVDLLPIGSTLNIGRFQLDWMVVAFIVLLIGIIVTLYMAQKDKTNTLDIYDLVTENGRLSKTACVMMGAFAVTSWMMVTLTVNGKITEGYFLAYGSMWVAPLVTRIIKGPQPNQQGATQ